MTLPGFIVWRGLQLEWLEGGTARYTTTGLPFAASVRPSGPGWLALIIVAGALPAEQLGNSPTEALEAAADWWSQQVAAIPGAGGRAYADTVPPSVGELLERETQRCPACGLHCRRVELQLCPECGNTWQLDPRGDSQRPEES